MSVPPCPWCQAKPMTVRAAHGRSERTFCPACYRLAVTVGGECNSRLGIPAGEGRCLSDWSRDPLSVPACLTAIER